MEVNKMEYECECLSCKKKVTSNKHCMEMACPSCGGRMRRVERPGVGQ